MPKASPAVIVALLIATSLFAPATVGGVDLLETSSANAEPAEGISENTTNVLQLQTISASGFGEPRVVVLDATQAGEAELDTAFTLFAVQHRLETAPNSSVRREILQNVTEAAANDVRALQSAESDARAAFVSGEISAQEYAQRLAVIHARATALSHVLGGRTEQRPVSLYSLSSTHGDIQKRVAFLNEELNYLRGPVRAQMAAAIRGERAPIQVFVAGSKDGFILAHIRSDGTFVRSTYRADNTDSDSRGSGSIESILKATQLYPWAVPNENLTGPGSVAATPITPHGSIHVSITHPHGRLVSYYDETTEKVYYETQYKRLETMPVGYAFNRTKNDTRVLVSKTYPGGPLQVTVLNVSGGNTTSRIDVPVTVNESTTHRTDADGIAWFVSPAGDYNVTTTYNETEFHFNVTG